MSKRIELPGLTADERIRGERLMNRGDLEPLTRPDAQPRPLDRTPSARAAVLAGPGTGPVGAVAQEAGTVAERAITWPFESSARTAKTVAELFRSTRVSKERLRAVATRESEPLL